ncbi:MAG TPA: hypothetical protein VH042_00695 [Solirubrobacterales bacterium]|jgi:hypothetical protein|nr:hypothetical protein [Solirubrobacterales bacterium]
MNGRVVLVAAVGAANGSRAAAAALACAGSEPDRPGLLIDVGGRPPRPTLVASSGARELEERLTVHLPEFRVASRGGTCHLALPGDAAALEHLPAALPLVRDAVAVLHVPPGLFQDVLRLGGVESSGVLLRAELDPDRALTALTVGELQRRDLLVRVLKRPLAWVPARRALFGVLPPEAPGGLPLRLRQTLLESEISAAHACYADLDDSEANPEGAAQQQRRGDAGPGRGGGLHRDQKWQAGR